MRKANSVIILVLAGLFLTCHSLTSYAQDNVDELKKQIEMLQKRVDELEAAQNASPSHDPFDFFDQRTPRRWDPFAEMNRMQEEMNRLFQSAFSQGGWSDGGVFSNDLTFDYELDLQETEDSYKIQFDMTGLDQEKVDIEVNEHSITVKGEHSREDTQENQNGIVRSQSFGTFIKTIPLPVDADTSNMKTEKEGDSLVITLPKKTT